MTIASFFERQHELTLSQGERAVREKILPQYRQAFQEIDANLKDVYAKVLVAKTPTGVKPNYYNEVLKYGRYQSLMQSTRDAYNTAARRAGLAIRATDEAAFANSFYLRQFAYDFIVPDGLQVISYLPQALIDLAVLGTPEVWASLEAKERARITDLYGDVVNYQPQYGTLQSVLLADNTRQLTAIQNAITQGFIQGQSYTNMSKQVRQVFNTTASNAMRIVRTEGNRLANAGNFAASNSAKEAGVSIVRQWNATLDGKTREDHARLDGQNEDKDGFFKIDGQRAQYPSHFGVARLDINCRCTTLDIVAGRTPETRTGRNPFTGNENETFSFKDFDSWAKENNLRFVNGILRPTT